jgi:YidC/Oxa1 family membrane protein insertase
VNGGSILRFLLISISGVLIYMWMSHPDAKTATQPIQDPKRSTPEVRAAYEFCEIKTGEFQAKLSSRGAVLKHFRLVSPKYTRSGESLDISTTPQPGAAPGTPEENDPSTAGDHEFRQQLFVQFRNLTVPDANPDADWGIPHDSVDWQLKGSDGTSCQFAYTGDQVELTKVIAATGRPYELSVKTTIKNTSNAPKVHAAAIDTVAWWLNSEVEGKLFQVSPYITHVECILKDGAAIRKLPTDFEPDDFAEPEFQAAGKHGWYTAPGQVEFASVSNAYFTHALVPMDDKAPLCQLQIRQQQAKDGNGGAFYRARLAYTPTTLAAGEAATYDVLTYVGPKERTVLDAAAGGSHNLLELIDLGFFSSIAKVLVSFLIHVHSILPNWGIAIITLTICARVLLFPLALPGIRTMLKMRELRPEMDKVAEKYKDDMQGRGQAQMQLMSKHGIGPMDQLKGCLPQVATMPVWFALYTTLQTAVELYNIPFLWFPDLSEPDPFFVLPFIIGGTYYVQQKIMPMTGDPAQRKMMLYFMPAMFTVFMIMLPSGLGVYMFTNSVLAIVQQQVVEWHAGKSSKGTVTVSVADSDPTSDQPKKRRKRRA